MANTRDPGLILIIKYSDDTQTFIELADATMRVMPDLNDLKECCHGWVTIGNFDGVHLGHQKMLKQLTVTAKLNKKPAIVVTFDPPPLALLAPDRVPPRLTSIRLKRKLLEHAGVDFLFEIAPDRKFLEQTPQLFFNYFLKEKLAVDGVMEGENFRFGYQRTGDIHLLKELCSSSGINCEILPSVNIDGYTISSTAIRQALLSGDLETANRFLDRPYSLSGIVVTGDQRGRLLGFPTANLSDIETLIPGSGVYKGSVSLDGKAYSAAIHLGENLTFAGQTKKVEVHLIDYSGDLYGRELTVDFIQKIRDIRKFNGPDELLEQIKQDIQMISQVEIGSSSVFNLDIKL